MTNTGQDQQRPTKRTKIRLACQECRDRKIRCDGSKPCNSCVRKGIAAEKCIYTEPGADLDTGYVKSLESRIRELEMRGGSASGLQPSLRQAHATHMSHPPTNTEGTRAHDAPFSRPRAFSSGYDGPTYQHHPESFERGAISLESLTPTEPETQPEKVVGGAMGATEETLSSTKSAGSVFLGPSSAAAFMNMIRPHSSKRKHSDISGTSPGSVGPSANPDLKEQELIRTFMESIVLPPRQVADEHMNNYWRYVHPLYPVLHRPTFEVKYKRLWVQDSALLEPTVTVDTLRAFYSTFNIILALGCTYSANAEVPPEAHRQPASVYFDRSQQLVTPASSDFGSLQLVQALVLSTQYLMSSNNVNRTWVTIGLAIRVAQGIGIHHDEPQESQAEREERRRTWWCCVLMDRVLSMTFGRSPMLTWPEHIPLPVAIDDEDLSMEKYSSSHPPIARSPSRMEMFLAALNLSDILHDILKHFYTPGSKPRSRDARGFCLEDCDPVLTIDSKLERWYADLPDYLRHGSSTVPTQYKSIYQNQAVTLHCRFTHIKILLFRPTTVNLSQGRYFEARPAGGRSILKDAFAEGCIESCTAAAQEMIDVLVSGRRTGLVPVWWYSVFYLYTAGTVLLATLLTPALRQAQSKESGDLNTSWDMCIQELSRLASERGSFAKGCLVSLQSARDNALTEMRAGINEQDTEVTSGSNADPPAPLTFDDIELLSTDYFNINGAMPTGGTSLESWWPNNNMEWLNSFPLVFDNNSFGGFGTLGSF